MPTNKPSASTNSMTDRKIAEFALEESRLSNIAYRFKLAPRDRVWKNWDRTEFEPNGFRSWASRRLPAQGRAGAGSPKGGPRARGGRRGSVQRRQPAQAIIVARRDGHFGDHQPADHLRRDHAQRPADFDRALEALDAPSPAAASPANRLRRVGAGLVPPCDETTESSGADA
jgi:hypothetical protein